MENKKIVEIKKNILFDLFVVRHNFKYDYVKTYLKRIDIVKECEKDEYTVIQNYIIWECMYILKPQIQRCLNNNTIYNPELISEYVSLLTPFDCSRFVGLGKEFILQNFEFWLRRYRIELSQDN